MNHTLTFPLLCLIAPLLSGCVTIEVPHLIQDTTKAGKEVYQTISARREARKRGTGASAALSHSYIGSSDQSTVQIKAQCETEAAAKLRELGGGAGMAYVVLDNTIVVINGRVAANCRLEPRA